MFGHQNDDQHQDNNEPEHDGVLEHHDDQANPALPADVGNFGAPSDDAPAQDDAHDDTATPEDSTVQPTHAHEDHELLSSSPANDLLDIKQQALKQLTPLVDHLDQSPEEKFRTTMMMIQASDDQSLVKAAYEAAKQITDEKAKAQALLDIVNEINYFTHQTGTEA